MSIIHELEDMIRGELPNLHQWSDLKEEHDADEYHMDQALEGVIDIAADSIYCDLEPMVNDWLEKYGGQITELMAENLGEIIKDDEAEKYYSEERDAEDESI